jgi:hypothetical protein
LIEENSGRSNNKNGEFYDEENNDPISVMTLVAGKLWCGIRDRIFVVCPISLNVQVNVQIGFLQKLIFILAFIYC